MSLRSRRRVMPAAAITVLAVLALSLAAIASSGQTSPDARPFQYERAWALAGPCCGDQGDDIAVEPDGSFFVVGTYGALDLDGDGAVDQRSGGGHDPIIMKGRPSGELAWVRAPRSPAASYGRMSVAADRDGGAYLAGPFIDSLEFRSGERIVARGQADGMLARYSADGDPLWARVISGDGTNLLLDAASDATGVVYVVATIQGAVDLDGDGSSDATSTAANGLLVASYDRSGTLRWARTASSRSDVTAAALAVAPDGTVSVAGYFQGRDVDFDGNGQADLPDPGAGAPFVAHYDAAGAFVRAFALLGTGNNRIGRLTRTTDGTLAVSGYTQGGVDLDRDGRHDIESGDGRQVPYVAALAQDGTLRWARPLPPGERLSILDLASGHGRIAVSGLYQGRLDLDQDGQPDASSDADGLSEGFVALFDEAGQLSQVLAISGPGHDQARGVAVSGDGRTISVTGFVRLTADFDGDGVPEGAIRCDNFGDIIWGRYRIPPP